MVGVGVSVCPEFVRGVLFVCLIGIGFLETAASFCGDRSQVWLGVSLLFFVWAWNTSEIFSCSTCFLFLGSLHLQLPTFSYYCSCSVFYVAENS